MLSVVKGRSRNQGPGEDLYNRLPCAFTLPSFPKDAACELVQIFLPTNVVRDAKLKCPPSTPAS